jgi:hypothetical protein
VLQYYLVRGVLVIHNKFYSLALVVLLVVLFVFSLFGTVQAQSVTHFTSQDVFDIPVVNGTIRFSVNGSYTDAILVNDTWVFNNLTLSGSRVSGTLKFSAKNCDVIISSFIPSIGSGNTSRRSSYLLYSVEGVGEQVVNLGFDSSRPSHVSEWSVINQDSVFFAEGKTWKLLPDDTMVIRGISGTLRVVRYNYGYTVDNRYFYLRHSVFISTAVIVAVTVAIATIIKINTINKRLP